jgi:predicted amidohydrolase YtcJ
MDMILKNGNIMTMDDSSPNAEALAIQFGRIYRLGETWEIEKTADEKTEVIDLKGRTVLPGFIDSHNHFCLYAMLTDQADCRRTAGCLRSEDVLEALRIKAKKTPPGGWVMGWGYAPYLLDDKKELTRKELDGITRDHAICLVHVSIHGAVLNSRALGELGFNKNTPDPMGGKIHRDSDGNPNGIISESAFMGPLFFYSPSIYTKIMDGYDRDGKMQMMERCARRHHQLGIVGVHDPFVDAQTLGIYQEAVELGNFRFRINAYISNHWSAPLISAALRRGFGSDWLKIGAIKIFLDGGMSSRTAAVFEPYVGENGGTGILNYDQGGINEEILKFDRAGYQISVHAQGDRALDMLLRAFERTMKQGNPLRHHIVHAGNLTASQIDRLEDLGLYIVSQANFFSLLGDGFIEAYGPIRSQNLYRFNTFLSRGIRLALSSDCPVADPNPFVGVRDAICRKTGSGLDFGPSERINAEQAFPLYTREAAYISFEENERGTLSEGKFADLIAVDRDPMQVSPGEMADCEVELTIVGGKVVYCQF